MQEQKDSKELRRLDDLKLIQKIRTGDQESLERLVNRYLSQLVGFFYYLKAPQSMIDDLVQETFEKIIRNLDKYDDRKAFFSWLLTVARNHYFDQCRKEKRKNEFNQAVVAEPILSPEDEVIDRETASAILRELSSEERFLLDLRIFQRMPFAEIAEITGEVETTLRSRFFRLLGRLRISRKVNEITRAAS